jgi:hypothetical protein
MQNVASFGGVNDAIGNEMRTNSMKVAKKASFEILARCFYNSGIKELINTMIGIF